jgi:hypothetical protein
MATTLNRDIYYQVFDKIKDAKAMVRLSQTCKSNNHIYSKKYKAKCELDRYQVDYKDPTNFIYAYNRKEIPFTKNGDYDLIEILKIYMLQFNTKEIQFCECEITSFPVYPNMTYCTLGPKLFGTLN